MTSNKVLRDPIHDFIHVDDEIIVALINTPEFQRLRRIKQLGVTSFVFHGAEHSRFGHSVGAYELARRITAYFQEHYPSQAPGDGGWDNRNRLLVLVAALLHDIGHGAFSHTFEHLFGTDHEAYTQAIVTGGGAITQILQQVSADFPAQVAQVIAKTHPNKQVTALISSQLDVDRMDYLLRDAYFTGTKYGQFDLERILRTIKPMADGIGFIDDGMHAVEDYIVSRYQMYQQVYFHPVSRGLEVILDRLLTRARDLYQHDPQLFTHLSPLLVPVFRGEFTTADYLALDDHVLFAAITEWRQHSDAILADLAMRFLDRKPLQALRVDHFPAETRHRLEKHLTAWLTDQGFDPIYYLTKNTVTDLPYDDKEQAPIWFVAKDNQQRGLAELSRLIAAIKSERTVDERYYFPKHVLSDAQYATLQAITKKTPQSVD